MDITILTQTLIDNRFLRNQQEISLFEKAITSIIDLKNVSHIEYLCLGFDDQTQHDEVMFGLIHAIESYDKISGPEQSLKVLAKSLPNMLPYAKEWAKILHKRILNHELSRRIYSEVISHGDESTKRMVLQLVNEIKERNPKRFKVPGDEFVSLIKK